MKKNILIIALISIFTVSLFSSCKDKEENTAADNNQEQVKDTNKVDSNTEVVENVPSNSNSVESPKDGKVHTITSQDFKDNIFDYMAEEEWNYKGTLPCVVDFYADWCGPCKMIAPIMEELAEEYQGKVVFYKVDVDAEGEVASVFGIQSIPSILFVPAQGQPQMSVGAMEKEGYVNAITEVLGVN